MENPNKKIKFPAGFYFFLGVAMAHAIAYAGVLTLSDAPLSQVIELYSKETGKNVFVDEGVQQQRKVTAHLKDMKMDQAFGVVQRTIGLESTKVGTNTIILYPPEKAQRYQQEMKAYVLRSPEGIDAKWLLATVNALFPGLKAASSTDPKSLIVFGTEQEINKVKEFAKVLPQILSQQEFMPMNESEAKNIQKEVPQQETSMESSPFGLSIQGSPGGVKKVQGTVSKWQKNNGWGKEIYTPKNLDVQKILKAAAPAKGRTIVSDLGGTGSILIEGPQADRKELLGILKWLDVLGKKRKKEIFLGEIKTEAAREAVRGFGVTSSGDRKMLLVGRSADVEEAASALHSLGQKKNQVLVQFRLAEIAKSRLKTLGIDLSKSSYTYDEIKSYHPNDTLPLLLRALNEGHDGRILADPNLRVIEGEEAKVTIGDRIPLEVAATAQTDSGSTLKLNTQLQWVDVGIKMTVKNVAVNPDGSIRMGIKGEVSSVVSTTKQGYPQIRTREAESFLRLMNGGCIVMGGLINHEIQDNKNKIPFFGNIPLLGGLARSRDKRTTDTEIIMIVTAKLVQD